MQEGENLRDYWVQERGEATGVQGQAAPQAGCWGDGKAPTLPLLEFRDFSLV